MKTIEAALQQGFAAYGFSSHAPLPFPASWSMKKEALPAYLSEISNLKSRYQSKLQIYCGLEVDFIPDRTGPQHPAIKSLGLDYTIGSVHFVDAFADGRPWEIDGAPTVFRQGLAQIFRGDIQMAVRHYFELTRQMVLQQCPTLVAHLDKIKMQNTTTPLFSETERWYQEEVMKTLAVIAEAGAIVEVNTRGLYQNKTTEVYPGRWVLAQMQRLGIPVTLSSDAHKPREIASRFDYAASLLLQTGYQQIQVLLDGKWQPVPLHQTGIRI
jgi:histidinol-phosphatase (PHP family)